MPGILFIYVIFSDFCFKKYIILLTLLFIRARWFSWILRFTPEAEFLDEIQAKVSSLLFTSTVSSFALRFLFLKTHATSYLFLQFSYWKPQVWELSRLCPETSTKLHVCEFGFCSGEYILSASPWRSFPDPPIPGCKGRSGHPVPTDKMSKGCSDTGMIHLRYRICQVTRQRMITDQSGFDRCEITEGGVDSVEYCSGREPGTALLQSGDLIM